MYVHAHVRTCVPAYVRACMPAYHHACVHLHVDSPSLLCKACAFSLSDRHLLFFLLLPLLSERLFISGTGAQMLVEEILRSRSLQAQFA